MIGLSKIRTINMYIQTPRSFFICSHYLQFMLLPTFPIELFKIISGFDGGLPANFLLELYNSENMVLKSQVTNKVPIFEVSNIDPGVPIKLYLYAENAKEEIS